MRTRNCVISAVGQGSVHRMWTEGCCDFELHLIVYDDSMDYFRNDAEYVCHIRGYKLNVIHKYLEANPQLKDKYDYFFLPDDDIRMDAAAINSLFAAMRRYGLKIAQPSLKRSYYTWPHTLHDPFCKLRYTNFVEMMVPCFSREALNDVLFTFGENSTGWGTETHWPRLIGRGKNDMAIIDEIMVVHSRPIQSGQELHNRELTAYLNKYGLVTEVEEYGCIGEFTSGLWRRDIFLAVRDMLVHWIGTEVLCAQTMGMDGYFGYAYFLSLLSMATESRQYADMALDIISRVQDYAGMIIDDMSFRHGITGCAWLVRYLYAEGLVDDSPDSVLEYVDKHILCYGSEHVSGIGLDGLAGLGKYLMLKNHDFGSGDKALCSSVAVAITDRLDNSTAEDIGVVLDALDYLKWLGHDTGGMVRKQEKAMEDAGLGHVSRAWLHYRLYKHGCGNTYLRMSAEELSNLHPQLITLDDAVMLCEMMTNV